MASNEPRVTSQLVSELTDLLRVWKDHRRTTIEDVWMRSWKNYNGIDDASVPPKTRGAKAWRSTSFFPLVEQKVTAAVSLLDDVLFKAGKLPFELKNSPVGDMIQQLMLEATQETIQQIAMQQQLVDEKAKRMKSVMDDQFEEC